MKVSAINTPQLVSFRGHWKNTTLYNANMCHIGNQKIYLPDKNETPTEIAYAWREETGKLPIDWVKDVNPYNQLDSRKIYKESQQEYFIQGKKYMPLDVLKASALIKYKENSYYESAKLDNLITLAELSSMENNQEETKKYERKIVEMYEQDKSITSKLGIVSAMNRYKDNWGKAVHARATYTDKDIYEDSDIIVANYKE